VQPHDLALSNGISTKGSHAVKEQESLCLHHLNNVPDLRYHARLVNSCRCTRVTRPNHPQILRGVPGQPGAKSFAASTRKEDLRDGYLTGVNFICRMHSAANRKSFSLGRKTLQNNRRWTLQATFAVMRCSITMQLHQLYRIRSVLPDWDIAL
jgi:hypothetical protein